MLPRLKNRITEALNLNKTNRQYVVLQPRPDQSTSLGFDDKF